VDFAPVRMLFHPPREDLVAMEPVLAIKAHWRWLQVGRTASMRPSGVELVGTCKQASERACELALAAFRC
jgi:hypothetical protein